MRLSALMLALLVASSAHAQDKPNIILIFTDDQGYGDVGCYGAKGFKTPNLDRMAQEGVRFTSFYTGCPVCSGSRAALMTGRHYQRVGVPAVMFPKNTGGMDPKIEITIARILKQLGYATGIIGKWHLGHLPAYLPTQHGFDSYLGIPYSNDMSIDPNAKFAKDIVFRLGMDEEKTRKEPLKNGNVPLYRGDEVIEYPVDQSTLVQRYTAEAKKFIATNKDRPFFLYLPHNMPHGPLAASKEFQGRTKSLFGDVLEEVDWSVGEVLKAVKENGLDDKTLILFTCDNGTAQGSSGPLRAKKASLYEGGVRVPMIARWPGKIAPGRVSHEIAATVDVLPTFAKIAGGQAPTDRIIDGKDIRPLLFEKDAKTPHEAYFLAHGGGAVRSGQWKYYPWAEGMDKKEKKSPNPDAPKVQLYDLDKDLGETINLAAKHPEIVARLQGAFEKFRSTIKSPKD